MNDLYPEFHRFTPRFTRARDTDARNHVGTIVPAPALVINDSVPQNRVLTFPTTIAFSTSDGTWTMELLTKTPFGTDRLACVSFNRGPDHQLNGSLTTIE